MIKEGRNSLWRKSGQESLFLPTYLPDFNDIEHDFSVLKKRLSDAFLGNIIDQIYLRLLL
jgi:transposase